MVVFATPGMLHAGLSLHIFKKWAEDEKNMVSYKRLFTHTHTHTSQLIMSGYYVAGITNSYSHTHFTANNAWLLRGRYHWSQSVVRS